MPIGSIMLDNPYRIAIAQVQNLIAGRNIFVLSKNLPIMKQPMTPVRTKIAPMSEIYDGEY